MQSPCGTKQQQQQQQHKQQHYLGPSTYAKPEPDHSVCSDQATCISTPASSGLCAVKQYTLILTFVTWLHDAEAAAVDNPAATIPDESDKSVLPCCLVAVFCLHALLMNAFVPCSCSMNAPIMVDAGELTDPLEVSNAAGGLCCRAELALVSRGTHVAEVHSL